MAPPAPARVAVGDDARLEQPHGPEVVIEGRVLDCRARPLAGASVQLALGLGSAPASLAAQDAPAVTTTEDGRFAFVGKEPIDAAVSITLLARAPGHASSVLRRTLEAGLSWLDVGDLELIEGGGIDGRIIDGQGRGLAAATVSLQLVSPGALASRWIDGDAIAKPASADASGAYRFANLPPGAYRIVASAAKMQASRPRAAVLVEDGKDTEVAPITLSPGLELNGVVVGPGGLAVAGADVRVRSAAASERFDDHTTAREDGRFHMEHLPPAPLQVDVQAAGYLQAHQGDVDAAAGGELVIHLESGLGLSGTVLDADTGVPIERFAARIRVLGSLERGTPAQLLRRRIDALRRQASEAKTAEDRSRRETTLLDLEARLATLERNERATRARRVPADMPPVLDRPGGRFAFAGLDEGIHALDVTAPGYAFTSTAPIEVRRDLKTLALRVELRRGWSLAGVVVANREGAPVANASVELIAVEDARIATGEILAAGSAAPFSWAFASTGAHGDGILSARTDGEGRFRLGPVPPGALPPVRHAPTGRPGTHRTVRAEQRAGRPVPRAASDGERERSGRANPRRSRERRHRARRRRLRHDALGAGRRGWPLSPRCAATRPLCGSRRSARATTPRRSRSRRSSPAAAARTAATSRSLTASDASST
ncbi:MAG: carboxypeptidase-like regulatory domain-containing protein [Planctomycetota bacterium]